MPRSSYPPLFRLPNNISRRVQIIKSSCNFVQPSITSSLLLPNILHQVFVLGLVKETILLIFITVMRRLTTGIRSRKCVVGLFRRCANVTERTYTNPDNIAYCTPSLYGIAYCC